MSELDPAAVAARAVEQAVAAGADDAEAFASEESSREIRVHGGEVESLTAATGRGVGVRAWIGRRVGYGYGTDLSEDGIRAIGARAAEAAAAADEDEFAGAAAGGRGRDARSTASSTPRWPSGARRARPQLALAVEQAALAADPRVVGVEQAVYADARGADRDLLLDRHRRRVRGLELLRLPAGAGRGGRRARDGARVRPRARAGRASTRRRSAARAPSGRRR